MPRAAIVHQKNEPMRVEEITLRPVREGELRIRVAACGVCHSDLSVLNEYFACPTPVILGHEAAGIVLETGPGVASVAPGDAVVAAWSPACRTCRYCRAGKLHLCRLTDDPTGAARGRVRLGDTEVAQFLGVGGFAEEAILSENAVVRLDPSMPLDKASLLGCAVVTGYGAARFAAKVKPGDEVAVFGCGGVGLNVVQGVRLSGARTIVAIDLDDSKLDLARQFGATHVLRGDAPDLHKAVRKLTVEGQGVDYAFDAVGNVAIERTAFSCLCKGGELILVGIAHMKDRFELVQIAAVTQEKTVRGTTAGSANLWETVPELVSLYRKGELRLDELVTRRYRLDEVNEAMSDLREGRNARGVIVF
jgi:S-(hydroxymethyl)glutathione dehydrogenase/alcohol dehydrogenase